MDIEKLIEQLKGISNGLAEDEFPKCASVVKKAATALSMTQAENERLRAELEQVKRALAMMWFSYVNSDKEMPHSYETEVLDEAERILGPWAECMPKYLRRDPKED